MKVWRTEIKLVLMTLTEGEEPNHDHVMSRVESSDGIIDYRWLELTPEKIGEFDLDQNHKKKVG